MKNNLLTLATILTIGFFTNDINAQITTSADSPVGATIIQPLTVKNVNSLEFGNIMASTAAGSVTVSTEGVRSSTNVSLSALGFTPRASGYTVTGKNSATYNITLPSTVVQVENAAGNKMIVDNWSVRASSATADGNSGELDADGNGTFNVGATLQLGATQAEGLYSTSFTVTVDYN